MGYWDVVTGHQTWSDHISSQEQIKGFENALQKQNRSFERTISVGLSGQRDYQTALESGLGAVSGELNALSKDISRGMGELANSIDFGFNKLSDGIDNLKADFNVMMGDVIWKLEVQNETMSAILRTLQAPLDTQAKELRFRAEDAYQNGWYEEALNDFLESERKNYQDFAVHRSIGNIHLYHLLNLPKALEYFCKASKYAKPRDARQAAEAEYFAGIVCSLQHQFYEAAQYMTNAINLNPKFYDAWYMQASYAATLGDPVNAVRSLENAISGDVRYHERARTARVFDKVRPQIQTLLNRLMQEISLKAAEAKRSIDDLAGRCTNLLPEDQARMSRLFSEAEMQRLNAKTYGDYYRFTKMPQHFESELRAAESKWVAKEHADKVRAENERAEQDRKARLLAEQERSRSERHAKNMSRANMEALVVIRDSLIAAVFLYPVFGLVSCSVKNVIVDDNGIYGQTGLSAWGWEALWLSILIAAIGGIRALLTVMKASNNED